MHYHSVILDAVPPGCAHVLDVGCGQGLLTRRLRPYAAHITGIDMDPRSIELARSHRNAADITYHCDDFLAHDFAQTFDMVTAVAFLHHIDAAAGLNRMRELLRPGGVLAVVGLARDGSVLDRALNVPAAIGKWAHTFGSRRDDAGSGYVSPLVWPPPETYQSMRDLAGRLLPGVQVRRLLYWRYALIWSKPAEL